MNCGSTRLRAEIDKRLGGSATHQSTTTQTPDEMSAKTPKRINAQAKKDDEFVGHLLRDPEARSRIQEMIQKQVEDWVHQKIPARRSHTVASYWRSRWQGNRGVPAPGLGTPGRRRRVSTRNPPGLRCGPQTTEPPAIAPYPQVNERLYYARPTNSRPLGAA
jgi:hypothetical protein